VKTVVVKTALPYSHKLRFDFVENRFKVLEVLVQAWSQLVGFRGSAWMHANSCEKVWGFLAQWERLLSIFYMPRGNQQVVAANARSAFDHFIYIGFVNMFRAVDS
jgi:hypothetical protein